MRKARPRLTPEKLAALNVARASVRFSQAEARKLQREMLKRLQTNDTPMDTPQPNGKALKDCTFYELAAIGERLDQLGMSSKVVAFYHAILRPNANVSRDSASKV